MNENKYKEAMIQNTLKGTHLYVTILQVLLPAWAFLKKLLPDFWEDPSSILLFLWGWALPVKLIAYLLGGNGMYF